jgi:hypothetical protein
MYIHTHKSNIHTYIHTYTQPYMHIYAYIIHTNITWQSYKSYAYTHTHIHTYTHTHTKTRHHNTYIQAYIHTYKLVIIPAKPFFPGQIWNPQLSADFFLPSNCAPTPEIPDRELILKRVYIYIYISTSVNWFLNACKNVEMCSLKKIHNFEWRSSFLSSQQLCT